MFTMWNCMSVCKCVVCMRACLRACVHEFVHVYMSIICWYHCVCLPVCMCVCLHTRMSACVHVCRSVYLYVCLYTCMLCLFICVNVCFCLCTVCYTSVHLCLLASLSAGPSMADLSVYLFISVIQAVLTRRSWQTSSCTCRRSASLAFPFWWVTMFVWLFVCTSLYLSVFTSTCRSVRTSVCLLSWHLPAHAFTCLSAILSNGLSECLALLKSSYTHPSTCLSASLLNDLSERLCACSSWCQPVCTLHVWRLVCLHVSSQLPWFHWVWSRQHRLIAWTHRHSGRQRCSGRKWCNVM